MGSVPDLFPCEPHHGLRPPTGNETGVAIARGAVVAWRCAAGAEAPKPGEVSALRAEIPVLMSPRQQAAGG